MDPVLAALTQYGLPGIIIAALFAWIRTLQQRLDTVQEERLKEARLHSEAERGHAAAQKLMFENFMAQLSAERNARLDDAKAAGTKAIELHAEVHRTVDKVTDLVEALHNHQPRAYSHPQLNQGPLPER